MKHATLVLLGLLLSSVQCYPVQPAHADSLAFYWPELQKLMQYQADTLNKIKDHEREARDELRKQTQALERIARALEKCK